MIMDSGHGYDVGNRSGRIYMDHQHVQHNGNEMSEIYEGFGGKVSVDSTRASYWQREKARRTSSLCEDLR